MAVLETKKVLGKIGKTYPVPKCIEGKLCVPVGAFGLVEKCKKCNKHL